MEFYVKNVSEKYEMLLQRQLKPGDFIDLEEAFKGFCRATTFPNGRTLKAQYTEDQFDKFLDWVETMVIDRSKWEFVRAGAIKARPSKLKPDKVAVPKIQKEALEQRSKDPKGLTPQQIAWLPYDEKTADIISSWKTSKPLKYALKFAVNIHGQERVRRVLEDRISELASVGE